MLLFIMIIAISLIQIQNLVVFIYIFMVCCYVGMSQQAGNFRHMHLGGYKRVAMYSLLRAPSNGHNS